MRQSALSFANDLPQRAHRRLSPACKRRLLQTALCKTSASSPVPPAEVPAGPTRRHDKGVM